VETGRRLSLTAVLSVVAHGTSEQTVLSVIMSLFFVKLYAFYAPYSDDTDDVLAEVGQYQILFTFFAALIVQGELIRSSFVGPLGIALVCINMGVMLVPLRLYYDDYRKTKEKQRLEEEAEEENEGSNMMEPATTQQLQQQREQQQDELKHKTDEDDHDNNDNEIKPFPATRIEMAKFSLSPIPSFNESFSSFQEPEPEQPPQQLLATSSVKPSAAAPFPRKVISLKPLPFSLGSSSNKILPSPRFKDEMEDPDEDKNSDNGWDDYKPAPKTFPPRG
jgi:hypothetical protein